MTHSSVSGVCHPTTQEVVFPNGECDYRLL